jgi:hypothetical protein
VKVARLVSGMQGRTLPSSHLLLAQVLTSLYRHLSSQFVDGDYQRLLLLMRPVAFVASTSESNPISECQKEVFALLDAMPTRSEALMPHVVVELLVYISQTIGFEYRNSICSDTEVPATFVNRSKQFYLFGERTIGLLLRLLDAKRAESTSRFEPSVFHDTVAVLGATLMTKYSQYHLTLWRTAHEAFVSIVKNDIQRLNRSNGE